jgi:leucyl-tRNA synthetase
MARYEYLRIEKHWQNEWKNNGLYEVTEDQSKPKFYSLDMFPYPSGSGLHVGHPLGYIASDIVARYKRLTGHNVLHPMGFDAFGLPAEQYAIETGRHPADTTEENIQRYKEQLSNIGFSYDWSREFRTSDPSFYKWTQWIFSLLFNHYYDKEEDKAMPIENLISRIENGSIEGVSAADWSSADDLGKENILQQYRLAFLDETTVNWCEELGTVLANEEVKDGLSERGGYPVIRKKMKQWFLRITAYSDRLIDGLDNIDWSDAVKEVQKNWIGRSEGASVHFATEAGQSLEVFTTRPDTIFGATFMVVAPEHELLSDLCQGEAGEIAEAYAEKAKNRSELDRMSDVKTVTGEFTGSYAIHPFSGEKMPIWVADYVLGGYGTGAVMSVPAHDSRDHAFAKKFNLPIVQVVDGGQEIDIQDESFDAKEGVSINSDFLNGLAVKESIQKAISEIENKGIGAGQVNYKFRDAGFGRQRYWGEPFPIVYKDDLPILLENLPVTLPDVKSYEPTGTGESPLDAIEDWVNTDEGRRETNTMPGWAGSSWYFLRYMDPHNDTEFASKGALDYWEQVDLYIGGMEHATGHLLYSRFWTKFLYDLDYISFDEPFKKLVNQGMILAEDGQKMSKRYGNVVNPDDIVEQYGADTLRMYEMFLGPLKDAKPWNTHGIEGVYRFLKKLWNLFFTEDGLRVTNEAPVKEELKSLHKTIKKITDDIEAYSFNTSISAFMVFVNEMTAMKCYKREVLKPFLQLMAPFAPHITEELWHGLGETESIHTSSWPAFDGSHLVENTKNYPVSINGKTRTQIEFPLDMPKEAVAAEVVKNDTVQKWLEGNEPKKVIVVPGRIINIVI